MVFGINESKEQGLIDIWVSPEKAKKYKRYVDFCLDAFTVGGVSAIGAIAYESLKDGVCEYGARKIARVGCALILTPAAAATIGGVMTGCGCVSKASKIYRTGNFVWNIGITAVKGVAQGATLPQQAISLVLNGRTYTPLIHNETLLNSGNMTAIKEGIEEGLKHVNATALKEAAKEAAKSIV